MVTDERDEPAKAKSPIDTTLSGIAMEVILVAANPLGPMTITVLGIATLLSEVQP
jgi:hypothetical protein